MGWTRAEVLAVARATGRPVVEAWSDHDAGQMGTVVGPMLHHTGSDWSYPRLTAPTLKTVREGRADLQNALCMYYIDYAGTIYCITEKIAWHAGEGLWAGVTDGNGHYAGIEAESDGIQWTKATVGAYKRLAAEILRKTGRSVAFAPRHADYALPKGRKTDFSGMDPTTFLADVNADLAGDTAPIENEDDDMALVFITDGTQSPWWVYDGYQRRYAGPGEPQMLVDLGLAKVNQVKVIAPAALAAIPLAESGNAVELATTLVPLLAPALAVKVGASKQDVEDAIREVLGGLNDAA